MAPFVGLVPVFVALLENNGGRILPSRPPNF